MMENKPRGQLRAPVMANDDDLGPSRISTVFLGELYVNVKNFEERTFLPSTPASLSNSDMSSDMAFSL